MKAAPFEYIRATTIGDVFEAYAKFGEDAQIIAGGQSLMPILNMRLATPKALVDINGLSELTGITKSNGAIRIGSLTRIRELISAPEVAEYAPLLKLAAPHIAHPAIRNRGTVGGSLCHADPAAELPACISVVDGRMNITGPSGERIVESENFFQGIFETSVLPGELLSSIDIPVIKMGESVAFEEFVRRHGDYATLGLVARGCAEDGKVSGLKLVFFSVSDRPISAWRTAQVLEGHQIDDQSLRANLDAALEEDLSDIVKDVHTSVEAKKHLSKEILGRVLKKLVTGA